jgi:transcriptional regulator of acetoin/glycerol metabolism
MKPRRFQTAADAHAAMVREERLIAALGCFLDDPRPVVAVRSALAHAAVAKFGNISAAAVALKIARNTLHAWLEKGEQC